MARPPMAMQTIHFLTIGNWILINGMNELGMATQAVLQNNAPITRRDFDGFLEILQGERHRMPEALIGF